MSSENNASEQQSGGPAEGVNPELRQIQDRLQKLEISLSANKIQEIFANTEKKADFLADISRVEANPNEKNTFGDKYLKPQQGGQTKNGTPFEKLSDEDIGKLDQVDAEKYLLWLEMKENEQKQKTINEEQRLQINRVGRIKTANLADKEGAKVIELENACKKLNEQALSRTRQKRTDPRWSEE